ncbi:MAG TPA: NAD(P)/FAD-dependent oxidoreductase [Acidimicrobiales bacterium]|nr:NAD(P)/FAD-dependent oxidoreductase [Acidimicrobiales bacterium]
MTTDHDAIVVGARCAGAPTAMLLARRGMRVLLVDRSTFPSDTVSTLVIHPTGLAALRRWGLFDELVATGCRPMGTYSFDFGPVVIAGRPRSVDGIAAALAPRRTVLDKLLVDAAAASGVEVREGFTVEDILVEDGAVVGIRGHADGGSTVQERARVVIGADGHNSRVARAVGAEQYNELPVLENAFYTFWRDLPVDAFTTMLRGDRGVVAVPTNDELTLVLVGCPAAQAPDFKHDVVGSYFEAVDRVPAFAERLRAAERVDRFRVGGVPNFFRKPYGPGWALVGDAGYTKDPVTAQGISDAFRGAEQCTAAIARAFDGDATWDTAMGDYQQARDEQAMPIYRFTTELARLEPPPPDVQQLLGAVATDQHAMDDFVSVTAGSLSPAAFFDPDNVGRIMGAAAPALRPVGAR